MGFEPMTCCLRNSCSTPELHWLDRVAENARAEGIAENFRPASGFSQLVVFEWRTLLESHGAREAPDSGWRFT